MMDERDTLEINMRQLEKQMALLLDEHRDLKAECDYYRARLERLEAQVSQIARGIEEGDDER